MSGCSSLGSEELTPGPGEHTGMVGRSSSYPGAIEEDPPPSYKDIRRSANQEPGGVGLEKSRGSGGWWGQVCNAPSSAFLIPSSAPPRGENISRISPVLRCQEPSAPARVCLQELWGGRGDSSGERPPKWVSEFCESDSSPPHLRLSLALLKAVTLPPTSVPTADLHAGGWAPSTGYEATMGLVSGIKQIQLRGLQDTPRELKWEPLPPPWMLSKVKLLGFHCPHPLQEAPQSHPSI